MNITQQIQIAVARADLLICQLAALPWKRMAASVVLAWVAIHICKCAMKDR